MDNSDLYHFANFKNELFDEPPEIDIRDYNHADYQYELIMEAISEFQKNLDNEHEVALQLASFGQSIIMNVTDIGYANPSIIYFYGYVNGKDSTLIQHVSQLNFLLTSVAKADPNKPARRIGFEASDH